MIFWSFFLDLLLFFLCCDLYLSRPLPFLFFLILLLSDPSSKSYRVFNLVFMVSCPIWKGSLRCIDLGESERDDEVRDSLMIEESLDDSALISSIWSYESILNSRWINSSGISPGTLLPLYISRNFSIRSCSSLRSWRFYFASLLLFSWSNGKTLSRWSFITRSLPPCE